MPINPIIPATSYKCNHLRSLINLTPCVPLSFKGEGDLVLEEGLTPLLDAPLAGYFNQRRRGGVTFEQLLGLCALGGLGGAISMPAVSALIVDEGRKFGMGSTIGIFVMAFSIGMAIGPILSGVIADFANINLVFYFAAAMVLIGTIFFVRFTK